MKPAKLNEYFFRRKTKTGQTFELKAVVRFQIIMKGVNCNSSEAVAVTLEKIVGLEKDALEGLSCWLHV